MNIHKKLLVGISILLSPFVSTAFLPCGGSVPGVLNVGILPDNLPFSDWDPITNTAVGFDPLLITAAAKLLGYETVNFIGYGSDADALAALNSGEIDVYANSDDSLDTSEPFATIGVVTDISALSISNQPNGWQVNLGCCGLALSLEAAITQLVDNGTYAKILQLVRLNGLVPPGDVLGIPADQGGVLLEPFPFASSEIGTIPLACVQSGPNFAMTVPATNCISAFLQANCTPLTTFTGATGQASA